MSGKGNNSLTGNEGGVDRRHKGKDGEPITEAHILQGVKILREIIDRMNLDVIIVASKNDSSTISITGPDGGLLVGKKGRTLDELHFLFNRILRRKTGIDGFINIDVNGYRSRREEALKKMAFKLAEKAKREGKVIPIPPMNARSRRIIHLALASDKEVKTESEGEGNRRHVQIIPINIKQKT